MHKPPVPKAVKYFIPDTGLPSMRTLVEYKFVPSEKDASRIANEILADTRGYKSNEWDRFVFLIYETHRFRRESEWNQLLEQCGTAHNAQAIVICGESPKRRVAKVKRSVGKKTRTEENGR
jgi:hypothetical protein